MRIRNMPVFGGIVFLCLGIFLSCNARSSNETSAGAEGRDFIRQVSLDGSSPDFTEAATEAAVEAAFALDYRPQRPEPESPAETLSAALLSGNAGTGGGEGPRIIPGLRKLADYQTPYFDPQREAERIRAIR
ncbi:MAG: hypothetical protein LBP42_05220, partial [Treponema sp.]|nr:hypothetical protein [Treponema sp.]